MYLAEWLLASFCWAVLGVLAFLPIYACFMFASLCMSHWD